MSVKKNISQIRSRFKNALSEQSVINVIVLVAVLFLAVYLTVQLSSNYSTTVSTLRTQKMTKTESINLKGYIFRDEEICYGAEGSIADMLVEEGERVSAGSHIANIYTVAQGYDVEQTRELLASLTQRIRLIENGIEQAKHMSDASGVVQEIDRSYYAFLSALEDSNYILSRKEEKSFIDALSSYMVITGRADEAKSLLDSLVAEKQALIEQRTTGVADPLYTDESCYFYSQYDGYEKIFDYSAVSELDASGLDSMISMEKQSLVGVIGKKVHSSRWYIAVPVSETQIRMFSDFLENGRVRFDATFTSNEDRSMWLTLERVCPSTADGSAFVVFSCKQSPENFEFSRAQNLQIRLDSFTGYRVPESAVFQRDGVYFVYILNGNVVEQRRITPIGYGEGYYIVKTSEADAEDGAMLDAATDTESRTETSTEEQTESVSGTDGETETVKPTDTESLPNPLHRDVPYLEINDQIIISGNGLYDGKILK